MFAPEREYFDPTSVAEIEAGMRSGDVWFVGEDDVTGEIVGSVCAFGELIDRESGRIGQLGLKASHRGGTHGAALMQTAEQDLRGRHCKRAFIGVLDFKGSGLMKHYEKMGYTDTLGRRAPHPAPKKRCQMIVVAKRLDG